MDIKEKFSKKRNMLEHMLGLHALSYASLPASSLYDDACLEKIKQVSESSHIYMIGVQPKIDTHDVFLNEEFFCIKLKIDGEKDLGVIKFGIPEGFTFETKDGYSYIIDREGTKLAPTEDRVTAAIAEQLGPIPFHVKYIGQAYGKDGKRNVVDRLKKHETLQKIALKENKERGILQIIILELAESALHSLINPFAENTDADVFDDRLEMGIDKLRKTSEAERVSLYEAALIRYFEPEYNHHFKNSFPSTNMRILQDCYKKDFQGLVAEICFDNFLYSLRSDKVLPTDDNSHIARYDLHNEDDRKVFFSMK